MRTLFLTEAFLPETKSASNLFFELAESLVKRGHNVSIVTRMPQYNIAQRKGRTKWPARELSGIEVYRFTTPALARNIPLIRGFEHFILALVLFFGALRVRGFDAVLIYSPPLPLAFSGCLLGKIKRRPVVVNVQDLYPQTVIDLGLLKNKFLIWVSRMMEKFVYDRSDILTVHSEGNKEYVVSMGAAASKTMVIHNWVDTQLIKPGNKENDFSRRFDLHGKFVVSYAGTIGFAQGLEVVIEAANILGDKKNIVFILAGEGVKKNALRERAERSGLSNVMFIDTQPVEVYSQILNASDIGLVTLSKDLKTPAVPCKILSIMAAGIPVIASLSLTGDAPKIIERFNCGLCVNPGDPSDLAKAILNLYNNKTLREELGRNGRQAAETIFSRAMAVNKYEQILRQLVKTGD